METNSMRISSQSRQYAKVQNLMHNVNEQNLMAQHRHDIDDKNFLRYVKRFLIAGIMVGRFAENKEEFDFLVFTFFNTHTAKGKYRVGIRTSKKKLKAKRQKAKEWLKTRLNKNVTETMWHIYERKVTVLNWGGLAMG